MSGSVDGSAPKCSRNSSRIGLPDLDAAISELRISLPNFARRSTPELSACSASHRELSLSRIGDRGRSDFLEDDTHGDGVIGLGTQQQSGFFSSGLFGSSMRSRASNSTSAVTGTRPSAPGWPPAFTASAGGPAQQLLEERGGDPSVRSSTFSRSNSRRPQVDAPPQIPSSTRRRRALSSGRGISTVWSTRPGLAAMAEFHEVGPGSS